jgi:hypothetical protein
MPDDDVRQRRRASRGEVGDVSDSSLGELGEGARLPVVEPSFGEEGVEAALESEPWPGAAEVDERLSQLS